jgi:hypothetical protein
MMPRILFLDHRRTTTILRMESPVVVRMLDRIVWTEQLDLSVEYFEC